MNEAAMARMIWETPVRVAKRARLGITAAVLLVLMACGTASAQQGRSALPSLREGDVVLVEEYPWAASSKTDAKQLVMYLCRLGYPSVSAFRASKGLPAGRDLDMGTGEAIWRTYREAFGDTGDATPVRPELSVDVEATKRFGSFVTKITIRNAAGHPARILGHIRYQTNGDFTFAEPFVRATVEIVGQRGGGNDIQGVYVIRDGFGVELRAGQTIGAKDAAVFRGEEQLLNDGETGRLSLHLAFFGNSFRIMEITGESELLRR